MGFISNHFNLSKLNSAYNSAKKVIGNVFRPVNAVVNKIADTVLNIDDFVRRNTDHPLIRDIVGPFINNPIYGEIVNLAKDTKDATAVIRRVGGVTDSVIQGELKLLEKLKSKNGAVAEGMDM